MANISIVHTAGIAVTSPDRARTVQRCCWCGAILTNRPTRGQHSRAWPTGALVRATFSADGGPARTRYRLVGEPGTEPPTDSCTRRPPHRALSLPT